MTSFWSNWVIILTAVSIGGISWILLANRKTTKRDGENTTGHIYDGIEEYDNPLPAWWFYMFVITIVWGIGYLIAYPGMGNFPGVLGWTQVGQHEAGDSNANANPIAWPLALAGDKAYRAELIDTYLIDL